MKNFTLVNDNDLQQIAAGASGKGSGSQGNLEPNGPNSPLVADGRS